MKKSEKPEHPQNQNIRIFAMTHKTFTPPPDPMYIPLQVGRACHDALGYLGDDTGDTISDLNAYYLSLIHI